MTAPHPEFPSEIEHVGGWKMYKGRRYGCYDDGNSADAPYYRDLSEAIASRLRDAVDVLEAIVDHSFCDVTKQAARECLARIGKVPECARRTRSGLIPRTQSTQQPSNGTTIIAPAGSRNGASATARRTHRRRTIRSSKR